MSFNHSSHQLDNHLKAEDLLRELVQSQLEPQDPAIKLVRFLKMRLVLINFNLRHIQVHEIINQMIQSKPHISAAGYFVINKKMIPKVITPTSQACAIIFYLTAVHLIIRSLEQYLHISSYCTNFTSLRKDKTHKAVKLNV